MIRLASLAVVLALSGCQRCGGAAPKGPDAAWLEGRLTPETGAPREGGTLVVRVPIEPVGLTRLHDRFNEGTMVRLTVGPIYETLTRLAQTWSESDDHLTLTITLREGVKFHDGHVLDSHDVKATIDVVMNEQLPTAGFRASLETLSSVETPDPRTVIVRWSKPYFLATHTLLAALPVMPASALVGDFDTLPIHRAPIGTGPFRFEKWDPGTSISLVRADDRAHLERVVYRFVKDDPAAMQAFEKGEFGLMTRLTPSAWRALESQPWAWQRTQRIAFPENTWAWLGFNQRKAMFADVATRRALAMLYPADTIEKTVDLGLEPRTTCPYYPGSKSCDPTVTPLPFDPSAAKRLLAEAGWTDADHDGVLEREGVKFSFAFLAAAQSVKMTKLLPLFLDTLKAAGIDARIETVDVSAYLSRVRAHDFDAMALSWSSADEVQDNFANFHSSQAESGNNFLGYRNPEVDRLLEQIRDDFDAEHRASLEREVHRRVYADQAYLFMGRRPALDAAARSVHGLKPSLGWYDLSAVWIAN